MIDDTEQPTFDADGSPSPLVDFDWASVETACGGDLAAENEALRERLAQARQDLGDALAELVGLLACERNPTILGRMVHLLAFLLKKSSCPSQAALARLLHIPRSRVTEAKRRIPNKLRPLLRLRKRRFGTSLAEK